MAQYIFKISLIHTICPGRLFLSMDLGRRAYRLRSLEIAYGKIHLMVYLTFSPIGGCDGK
jgi:hypothetical protein